MLFSKELPAVKKILLENKIDFPEFCGDHQRRLNEILSTFADVLKSKGVRVETPEIDLPEFFVSGLDEDSRKLIEDRLSSCFARRSVEEQKIIAKVPVVECYEPFVGVEELFADAGVEAIFSDYPFNQACGQWAGKRRQFVLRKSVAEKMLMIGEVLKTPGIDLMIRFEDCFRPVGVQEGLFMRRVQWILKENPLISMDDLLLEAMSKTAVTPRLASHKAGAAVDFVLINRLTKQPLDLGNRYPEGGAIVAIDFPFLTENQWMTRQIFKNFVLMAGGAIYKGEDWHASFGDNLAGYDHGLVKQGYVAKYGPVKNANAGGVLGEIYLNEELDNPFLNINDIEKIRLEISPRRDRDITFLV